MYKFQYFDENIITQIDNECIQEALIHELNILGKEIQIPDKIKKIAANINVKKSTQEYKKYMTSRFSILKKVNVDINSLRKEAVGIGKSLKNELESSYKKGEDPKKVAEKLKNKITGKVNNYVKSHLPEMEDDLTGGEKIGIGIALIIGTVMINTIFFTALSILFTPIIGLSLTAIFVAPVIEEGAKSIALQQGITYGKQWTFVFASAELVNYMINGAMAGMALVPLLIGRLIAVLFHLATVSVQAEFVKKDKTFVGYVVGVLMHMAWNTMAVLGSM